MEIKKEYSKHILTINDQIEMLKKSGLKFNDENFAQNYLSNIYYYYLSSYSYSFQDNKNTNLTFKKNVYFEDLINLFDFDRKLCLLIFEILGHIEIALKNQIIYHISLKYGSHWYLNQNIFKNQILFLKHNDILKKEIKNKNEMFINNYENKYSDTNPPPSWICLEIINFGLLSKIYQNLKYCKEKDNVALNFGLKDSKILENWMHCFSLLKNICLHNSRIWNRRFQQIKIPKDTIFTFLENENNKANKLFLTLSCMKYIINIISPNNTFKERLEELITSYKIINVKEMGFPENWNNEKLWKQNRF